MHRQHILALHSIPNTVIFRVPSPKGACAAPFWMDRDGSCWLMTHSLNEAVRIHPGGAVSLSAAFRNSDIKFIPPPGRLPCRKSSRFLHKAGTARFPGSQLHGG